MVYEKQALQRLRTAIDRPRNPEALSLVCGEGAIRCLAWAPARDHREIPSKSPLTRIWESGRLVEMKAGTHAGQRSDGPWHGSEVMYEPPPPFQIRREVGDSMHDLPGGSYNDEHAATTAARLYAIQSGDRTQVVTDRGAIAYDSEFDLTVPSKASATLQERNVRSGPPVLPV